MHLPPEDQPSGRGLIDSEDGPAAIADFGDLDDPQNPMRTAFAFFMALVADDQPILNVLHRLCTPESSGMWDFDACRSLLSGRGLATRPRFSVMGDPNVCYAVCVPTASQGFSQADGDLLTDGVVISMQWRPERGCWLVHAFGGEYVLPEHMPH